MLPCIWFLPARSVLGPTVKIICGKHHLSSYYYPALESIRASCYLQHKNSGFQGLPVFGPTLLPSKTSLCSPGGLVLFSELASSLDLTSHWAPFQSLSYILLTSYLFQEASPTTQAHANVVIIHPSIYSLNVLYTFHALLVLTEFRFGCSLLEKPILERQVLVGRERLLCLGGRQPGDKED